MVFFKITLVKDFVDYYEILGVDFGSSVDEIKSRFRHLAKLYHPDVSNKGDNTEKVDIDFRLILEAYKVLSDPNLRVQYDKEYLEHKSVSARHEHRNEQKRNVVDPRRVEYNLSLVNISRAGFKISKRFKRDDYLEELGEDIVVYLTDEEVRNGALLNIDLPAKAVCPVCYGGNRNCYLCDGRGVITVIEKVSVELPPNLEHLHTLVVDLKSYKPKRKIIRFSLPDIKIKVKWLSLVGIE